MDNEILFVYNADSSIFSKATDFAHKTISPKTYACSLCAITYGIFSMEKNWKEYLNQANFKFDFLYKSRFKKLYPDLVVEFPVILIKSNTLFDTLIGAAELNSIKKLDNLIVMMQTQMSLRKISKF